jgi:murein DD-endopeptidase MepM/ murein hydrolase activator NlpD
MTKSRLSAIICGIRRHSRPTVWLLGLLFIAVLVAPAAAGADELEWPVPKQIDSGFGPRDGGMHTGLDLDADTGTPIAAAAGGRVLLAETYFGYGLTVIIGHGDSISTLYGHLSRTTVEAGEVVEEGERIGLVGCSGDCTGDHLHFEVRVADRPVNPIPYLPDGRPDPACKVPLDPGYAPLP